MYLTDQQLSQLRHRPHRTRLWLSIFKPNTVVAGQINQPDIEKGERDITLNVSSGNINEVIGGMTCYYSTVSGGKDLGRIRVRDFGTGSVLSLAENSIHWIDGWHLTVVRYFEPWAMLPRIILDDDDNPIFYKDWDIAYTDQNEFLDPVVCLGPHHAGFLELGAIAPTGSHNVWYTSSGSFDPTQGGSLSSYLWIFEGGTPTSSTSAHPGEITYTGCGHFTTSLRIQTTGSGSQEYTGYRHVSILTKPDSQFVDGGCLPHTTWGLRSLDGDRESGGYTGNIWIREPVDTESIVDGALVVIFSEDWEGTVETKRGANAEGRDNILFVGYIVGDSISYDAVTSVVEFDIENAAIAMEEASAVFTGILDDEETPDSWNELKSLTMDRALVHFLRWHSTLLAVTDFSPTNDTKRIKSQVFVGRGIFEIANNMMQNALMARMVSDRQGKIWTEIDASVQPTGSFRQSNDLMQDVIEMTRQDWRGQLSILRVPDSSTAYMEMGGIAYAGWESGTNAFAPYLGCAPGLAPDYHGDSERISGLVLDSQEQLNELVGHSWARVNALYPEVTIPVAGDYRFIDIAPQQRVLMTVSESDTWRNIEWNQKPFIPQAVAYDWMPEHQTLHMELVIREETWGQPGDTIIIPDEPPWNNPRPPPWNIEIPPIIPPGPWEPPIDPPPGEGDIVYVACLNQIAHSTNFTDAYPNWTRIDNGVGVGMSGGFNWFELDPHDPLNTAWCLTSRGLYRTTNLFNDPPTWTMMYGNWEFAITAGLSSGTSTNMNMLFCHKKHPGWLMVYYVCDAGGPDNNRIAVSEDGGVTWQNRDPPAGTNQTHPMVVYHQEANPGWGVSYATTRKHASYGLMRSWNGGQDGWSSPLWTNLGQIGLLVPYDGNMGAGGFYFGSNNGFDHKERGVQRSLDYGANYTDVTPEWGGYTWAPMRGDPLWQAHSNWHAVDRNNSANLYALLQRNTPDAPGDYIWRSALFRRGSWYSDWEFLFQFVGLIGALHMHPTNPLKLYCIGLWTWGSGNYPTAYIMASEDGGRSWSDKLGDWETSVQTIGNPDRGGMQGQAIQVVWNQ